jgi:hypothetical protein
MTTAPRVGELRLIADNPIYRGETIGSYFLVFNTILTSITSIRDEKLDQR